MGSSNRSRYLREKGIQPGVSINRKDWYIKIDDSVEVKPYMTTKVETKLEKSGKLLLELLHDLSVD